VQANKKREVSVKKIAILIVVFIFGASGVGLAKSGGRGKHQPQAESGKSSHETYQDGDRQASEQGEKEMHRDRDRNRERVREHEQSEDRSKKVPTAGDDQPGQELKPEREAQKVKGHDPKTEPPKGIQNASEKGKGKKKGLFERWFGGSKDESKKQ
jgi:hypothetical protein